MKDYKNYLEEIQTFSKFEKVDRMTLFAALFTEILEEEGIETPIVVGGLSLEIYTHNNYTTVDIDMVLPTRDKAGEILENLGFEKSGKDWFHDGLGLSIEIPDSSLDGSYDKVIKVQVGKRHIHLIGIEDIFIHRLQSAVATNNAVDAEWAYR